MQGKYVELINSDATFGFSILEEISISIKAGAWATGILNSRAIKWEITASIPPIGSIPFAQA